MSICSNSECYWLALQMIQGIGNIVFKNLLEKFGDPTNVFDASVSELSEINGIRKEVVSRIANRDIDGDPEEELGKIRKNGARLITYNDTRYPAYLRETYDPPMILYAKGKDIPPNRNFISMVGSRNPTHYGIKAAEKIGQGIARRGLGIVSGMAKGIDSASHWGCLDGKGFTIAVLGTGVDIVYPALNRKLYNQIIKKGMIISEFPMGTPPSPGNFPVRNRVISGIGLGTIVVEATMKSGSLITASMALDQGREVFAVPGSIDSFKSLGCHYLIKQGAKLIENSDDVLDELGLNYPYTEKTDTFVQGPIPAMDESEQAIYDIIGDYPIHIDQIARLADLEPKLVSGTLMRLELKGIIRQLHGKMFVR